MECLLERFYRADRFQIVGEGSLQSRQFGLFADDLQQGLALRMQLANLARCGMRRSLEVCLPGQYVVTDGRDEVANLAGLVFPQNSQLTLHLAPQICDLLAGLRLVLPASILDLGHHHHQIGRQLAEAFRELLPGFGEFLIVLRQRGLEPSLDCLREFCLLLLDDLLPTAAQPIQ